MEGYYEIFENMDLNTIKKHLKVSVNNSIKVSVVIGTYNGEKYIEEQLLSIFKQTHNVDEVLIFDDGSNDNTINICRDFISSKTLVNWKIAKNEQQKGVFFNFINGAKNTTGDIIFFADQDDIWLTNKVEEMITEFIANPKILSLSSTFSRFDGNLNLNSHVKHPNRKKHGIKMISIKEFCTFPYYLGMSMAISKKLLNHINNILLEKIDITHDIYLNFIASLYDGFFHLDKVVTKRRSYNESTSNKMINHEVDTNFGGNNRLHSIYYKTKILNSLLEIISHSVDYNNLKFSSSKHIINQQININNQRYIYMRESSILKWTQFIIYINNLNSLLIYIKDGLCILKSKAYSQNAK